MQEEMEEQDQKDDEAEDTPKPWDAQPVQTMRHFRYRETTAGTTPGTDQRVRPPNSQWSAGSESPRLWT